LIQNTIGIGPQNPNYAMFGVVDGSQPFVLTVRVRILAYETFSVGGAFGGPFSHTGGALNAIQLGDGNGQGANAEAEITQFTFSQGDVCDPSNLSGSAWVGRFPLDTNTADLIDLFQSNVDNFIAALQLAGANVSIQATYRLPQKAFLMHWAWMIAKESQDPTTVPDFFAGPTLAQVAVPAYHGPDTLTICWIHTDQAGNPDIPASVAAAQEMVDGWGIVSEPALDSEHSLGTAIDMNISWNGSLKILDASGNLVHIHSKPRTGMNMELGNVGATYGVIKALASLNDPPHWSIDGH
jgi:D-alanyl-D-alanine dipeptidase